MNAVEGAHGWLVGPKGDRVALPSNLFDTLVEAIRELDERGTVTIRREGDRLAIMDPDGELSPRLAAEMLNVSRPFVVKLLNEGVIPSRKVGTHHRVRLEDLNEYLDQVNAQREAARQALFEDLDDDEY
ncbi:MAG: helix-turn-helix domain-containing protein [Vicinamibacterales bacterium]